MTNELVHFMCTVIIEIPVFCYSISMGINYSAWDGSSMCFVPSKALRKTCCQICQTEDGKNSHINEQIFLPRTKNVISHAKHRTKPGWRRGMFAAALPCYVLFMMFDKTFNASRVFFYHELFSSLEIKNS